MVSKRRSGGRRASHNGAQPAKVAIDPSPPPLSAKRLYAFRIIAVLTPFVLLLLLELGLRIGNFGHPAGFSVTETVDGRELVRDNNSFARRFFPGHIARAQVPFNIPATKLARTYRIFVLGESAAQGIPDHTFSFSRILEVLLRDRYPGVNFQVVNTAITAANSYVIREIAEDCSRLAPDLFLVYMGNNEVVGPYGPGTVFTSALPNLSLIRAGLWLTSFRTGQLGVSTLRWAGAEERAPQAWRGMEMFLANQVREDDRRMPRVYDHFRRNLEDINQAARKSGARVLISTVATNLRDCAPFASLHRPDIGDSEKQRWTELYQEAIALHSAGKFAEAARTYLQAAEIDNQFADLHYRLASCYNELKDYSKASGTYVRARDLDTLRFRADSRVNDLIRSFADRLPGVHVIDAEQQFKHSSPNALPGEALFYEHVHMNFAGNYLLAAGMAEAIGKLVPEWVIQHGRPQWRALSEEECARRMAFTEWNRQQIAEQVLNGFLKRPPFTNQSNHHAQIQREQEKLAALRAAAATGEALQGADAVYRKALSDADHDPWLLYNYGVFLLKARGDAQGGAQYLQKFTEKLPGYAPAHGNLGIAASKLGRHDQAIAEFEEELRINPSSATAHANLGLVLAERGRLDDAIAEYNRALAIDPNHPGAHNDLGAAFAQRGRWDDAIREYREAIRLDPDHAGAHYNLASGLNRRGERTEVIKHYREALRVRWNWPQVHNDLAIALYQQGNVTGAITHWTEALRQKPDFAEGHNNLGRVLAERGELAEGIRQFKEALRINPNYQDAKNNLEILLRQGKPRL